MAVELEGLEFQIEAKSEEGTKGIDALTASLGKLKQATKGGLGLNSKVKELNKLNEALKGFHTDKLESLGKALASLNGLGKTQISSTIPKRLNEIAQSLHEIGLSDIERLEDLGKALRDLQEVGDVKIPKVTVPSAGVAPAMNGTTNAEAATSGVEQATSSVQETAHAVEQVSQKTGVLKSILGGIGGVFSKGFSVGTGALHKLANALTKVKVVGAKARDVLGKIKDVLGSALAAKVKQNTSGLGKLFTTWWNNVKRWWNDTVGDLWTTLKIKIPSISVKWSTVTVFGKDYSYPSGFNLTWNAKGGILDGAQIFGMLGNSFLGGGEAGKEAVLPLETHTEWMDTLAEKVRSGLPDNDTGGMEYGEFKRALADFYTEYVQGTYVPDGK